MFDETKEAQWLDALLNQQVSWPDSNQSSMFRDGHPMAFREVLFEGPFFRKYFLLKGEPRAKDLRALSQYYLDREMRTENLCCLADAAWPFFSPKRYRSKQQQSAYVLRVLKRMRKAGTAEQILESMVGTIRPYARKFRA